MHADSPYATLAARFAKHRKANPVSTPANLGPRSKRVLADYIETQRANDRRNQSVA